MRLAVVGGLRRVFEAHLLKVLNSGGVELELELKKVSFFYSFIYLFIFGNL